MQTKTLSAYDQLIPTQWALKTNKIDYREFTKLSINCHSIVNLFIRSWTFHQYKPKIAEFIPGTKRMRLKYMKIIPLFCTVKKIKIDWSFSLCIHILGEFITATQNVQSVAMTGIKNQSSNTWADDFTILTLEKKHVTWCQLILQQLVFPILWKTQQTKTLILVLSLNHSA